MSGKKQQDLAKMQELEQSKSGIVPENNDVIETNDNEETSESIDQPKKLKKEYRLIDGYRILERNELPFMGVYYPESWEFAYRCPTTKEVANFSTISEQDQPKIISTISELVRKCFTIIDREKQQEVPSHQINDGERLFFFLKLREFYLHDKPIEYVTMSAMWQEPVTIQFVADSLIYKQPTEALMEYFDGRKFAIPVEGLEEPIEFLIPTLDIADRIFRYMMKTYQEAQKETSDNMKESEAFNKQFLLMAPFLYVKGNENIESLKFKFKQIEKNDLLLDSYIQLINKLNFTNSENIRYIYKESEEEAPMKFPGGWKNMFVNKGRFGNLFE